MESRCARQHQHLRTAGPSRSVWSERVGRGGEQIRICCWDRYVDELYCFHTLSSVKYSSTFFLYSSFKSISWGSFTSPTPVGAIIWPFYQHVNVFVEGAHWSWFSRWFLAFTWRWFCWYPSTKPCISTLVIPWLSSIIAEASENFCRWQIRVLEVKSKSWRVQEESWNCLL